MKCHACDYMYDEMIDESFGQSIKNPGNGPYRFKELTISAKTTISEYYLSDPTNHIIYACPMCGTLKIDI